MNPLKTPCPGCGAEMFARSVETNRDGDLVYCLDGGRGPVAYTVSELHETVHCVCANGCEVRIVRGGAPIEGIPIARQAREALGG